MSRLPASRVHSHSCNDCPVQRSFCPLPADLRTVFEALKTTTALDKGETFFHEGEPCRSVFVICSGYVKLTTASSEGKVLLLRFAGPGDLLGVAEAVLGNAPYECSGVAAEPVLVAVIPSDTFLRFVGAYPDTCVRLTLALSEQYKAAQRETRFLAFGETSTARLARLLMDWSAERGRTDADGVHIPSRVTHTEIAQSIGSTRETVTRILGALNHRGIVERTPDEIFIRRAQELTRLGTY